MTTTLYGPVAGRYIDNDRHPLDSANCGSVANYRAHYRRNETPCTPCRRAQARYQKDRRERAKR